MSSLFEVSDSDGVAATLFESIASGAILVDSGGDIIAANEAAADYFSFGENDTGKSLAAVVPCGEQLSVLRSNGAAADELFDRGDTEGLPRVEPHPNGVELVVEKAGTRRNFIVRTEPISGEETTLFLVEDVTATREVESQFETVLGYSSDTVAVVRSDGTIRYLSGPPEVQVNSPATINVSSNILNAVHPDDKKTVEKALQAVSKDEQMSTHHCRLETASEGYQMFEITVRQDSSLPAVEGLILTARDVTDRHHFEQHRQVMNRILRHDLRNDMNVVVGHAKMLAESDHDQVARHAETIRKKALSLVNLGDKVRTIDKQLHGVDRELRQIHLSQIVREEIDSLHEEYPSVIIRSQIDETLIIGNSLIRIAISNILDNCIEHNDNSCPEIEVDVSYRAETSRVEVEIRDNGPGIPQGEKRAITKEGETPLEHISGLGLWLVKWIVDGMDGTLSITENSPRGTVVTLSLLAADEDQDMEEVAEGNSAALDPSRFRGQGRSSEESGTIGTTTRSQD